MALQNLASFSDLDGGKEQTKMYIFFFKKKFQLEKNNKNNAGDRKYTLYI
jgi:hypothetical protein